MAETQQNNNSRKNCQGYENGSNANCLWVQECFHDENLKFFDGKFSWNLVKF